MVDSPVQVAIVGMSCRFPGGANTPEKLWGLLEEGRNAWSDVPKDRFRWQSFHHPDAEMQNSTNHRGGHFLSQDVAAFDAKFFGVPSHEADTIDPQQRMLNELAYEALENAGIPLEKVRGSQTGVYIATFNNDYGRILSHDSMDVPKTFLTGVGLAMLANRVSYLLDLKGPSLVVDTACSGSLVALHQACQALRTGEIDAALTGAANLILDPDIMIPMSLQHFLNGDGRSYSFDAIGDGYGRGEGVGMVVLKRLDDALRDGDSIRAVIRNTGVGQDGKTAGITLPSADAQGSLIRSVYARAGLDPYDTTYVEAHGTGTVAGDIAELSAIDKCFCGGDSEEQRGVYVTSIKANIGHTESTSGIAGVIKAALAVEKGLIPPNPAVGKFKASMLPENSGVMIPQNAISWSVEPRRASINSFGYGGTNAHCILESAGSASERRLHELRERESQPAIEIETPPSNGHTPVNGEEYVFVNDEMSSSLSEKLHKIDPRPQTQFLLPVSTKSQASVSKAADNIRDWVKSGNRTSSSIKNLAHTLSLRRSILPFRYTMVAQSASADSASILELKARPLDRASSQTRLTFVFTGQGAQWFAMGRELLGGSTAFTESITRSSTILHSLGAPWNLVEELSQNQENTRVDEAEIGQPSSTAVQIALVDLLRSLGLKPSAVVGHSSGEIAAAYAAGILSQEDVLRISYQRSLLSKRSKSMMQQKGAMMAVGLSEKDAEQHLTSLISGQVVVACANSTTSTTVSGDEDAIDELLARLESQSVFARKLKVDTAYHSHHMQAVAESYLAAMGEIRAQPASTDVKFFSSVTGKEKLAGFDGQYWVENLVSRVKFSEAVKSAYHDSATTARSASQVFVEVGPHAALAGPVRDTLSELAPSGKDSVCLSALVRNVDAVTTILELCGRLFEKGYEIDLSKANSLDGNMEDLELVTDLQPYPWDHSTRYWRESRLSKEYRQRTHPNHELLGLRVVGSSSSEPLWRHILNAETMPWLLEHVVDGYPIFPASGYVTMAIEAKKQLNEERSISGVVTNYVIKDLALLKPLIIPDPPYTAELQISLRNSRRTTKGTANWESFKISSVSADGVWCEQATGMIMTEHTFAADDLQATASAEAAFTASSKLANLDMLIDKESQYLTHEQLYEEMKAKGNYYGQNFATIREYSHNAQGAVGHLILPDTASCMPAGIERPYIIHPGPLDALIHTCVPLFSENSKAASVMAVEVEKLVISATGLNVPGARIDFATHLAPVGATSATTSISAFTTGSRCKPQLVFELINGKLRGTSESKADAAGESELDQTYNIVWQEDMDLLPSGVINFQLQNVESPEAKFRLLNQGASLLIRACLQSVQLDQVTAQCVDFYHWMHRYNASEESEQLIGHLSTDDAAGIIESLHSMAIEGKGVLRIGQKLSAIVQGQEDVLALVAEDDLFFNAYTEDGSARCYLYLLEFVKSTAFKKSGLRILEIGAGTGGATKPLLDGLCKEWYTSIDRYDYTDVSPAFFERAKERFQEHASFMHFQELDITVDPIKQGFTGGAYDLVIASSSIHVAPKIDDAIQHARSLLKDGGRLLLVESTRVVPFSNMLFGHAPGWYCGVEDGRTDSPLLSKPEWNTRLARNGFDGVEFSSDDFEGYAQRVTFIAAQAICPDTTRNETPVRVIVSAHASQQHLDSVHILVDNLSANGYDAAISTLPLESFSGSSIYLIADDRNVPLLTQLSSSEWGSISHMLNFTGLRLLWVNLAHESLSRDRCEYSLMFGLCRSARIENPSLKIVTVDMVSGTTQDYPAIYPKLVQLLERSFTVECIPQFEEFEVQFDNGQMLIPRLRPNSTFNSIMKRAGGIQDPELTSFHQPLRPLKLTVQRPGLLDSMVFEDDERAVAPLPASEVEVRVEACGVNFKDVMLAIGQIDESIPMSGEFAGVVTAVGEGYKHRFKTGDRVFGVSGTPYASHSRCHGDNTYHCPDSMSFAECSSIPVVFCTAFYCLVDLARLEKGQSVLIHAAAGGVGQAAIQISQHIGAEVYVTVGTKAKKGFVMEAFNIPEDHIFTSRSTLFKTSLMRMTQNHGVDVVLNSLAEDLLAESLECVARFGSFLEIGKFDINKKNTISLHPFDKGINFFSVDVTGITKYRPYIVNRLLTTIMPLFKSGVYKTVHPINIMPISNIQEAFRLLQAGRHMGKVVLEASADTKVMATPKQNNVANLSMTGTYVVAGGLGGLGLEVGRYLASRGVKHVALLSRRALPAKEGEALRDSFRSLGTEVHLIQCDIATSGCQTILRQQLSNAPPVEGIIQSAMVTDNQSIDQMSLDQFLVTMPSKTDGTRNLLEAFKGSLKHLIMFSSVTGTFGSMRGSNYAAANAFQDAFATEREEDGIRVIAIDLGPMKDNGVLTREANLLEKIAAQGFVPWGNAELFALLDPLLDPATTYEAPKQLLVGFSKQSMRNAERSHVIDNPMLKHILQNKNAEAAAESGDSDPRTSTLAIKSMIESSQSLEEVAGIVKEQLAKKITSFSFMDAEAVTDDISISAFGLDSLVVVELKNWVTRTFAASLQSSEISDAPNLSALSAMIASRSTLVKSAAKGPLEDFTSESDDREQHSDSTSTSGTSISDEVELPKQPLPELAGSIERYLQAIEPICTPKDFAQTRENTAKLLREDGPRLQALLQERANDPKLDNWFADIYLKHNFLRQRNSLLAHSTFFSSQSVESYKYEALDVATALTMTAFAYKKKVEAGQHQAIYLVDGVIDMTADHNIYNTCRQPCSGEDRMLKYDNHDYIVVMRRGHAFKVVLQEGDQPLPSADLKEIFKSILALPLEKSSSLAALTGDRRDDWAKFREQLILAGPANAASLQTVEAAAFVVCFDDTIPTGPSERALQFLYGDENANRWYDKSLQLVICPDGTSASVVEHSLLDGTSVAPLREFLIPKVRAALESPTTSAPTPSFDAASAFTPLPFDTDAALDARIAAVLAVTSEMRRTSSFEAFSLPDMGSEFWRACRIAPKSGTQLLLLLAVRAYYGCNPPSAETVSLARFKRGRVTLSHTVSPEVKAFCDWACGGASDAGGSDAARGRALFGEAVAAINASVTRAAAGQSPIRNLLALKWLAMDRGEAVPELFEDAAWTRFVNEVVTVDCYESDFEECGLPRISEGLWIHFQPQAQRALFSVWGKHAKRADEFRACVEKAAEQVRQILG